MYKKREYQEDSFNDETVYQYVQEMHPEEMMKYYPTRRVNEFKSLEELIQEDQKLKYIYDSECFVLNVDGVDYKLESQILKRFREMIYITPESDINLYIKNDLLDQECDYPNNNSLYMILLSGNLIQYGDEGRTKQEHIATHQVYKGVLERNESDREGFFKYNITNMIREYGKYLDKDNPNNIFFTTNALRDYHYTKQKNNAYYHIDAINLPFQNIEFYYIGGE